MKVRLWQTMFSAVKNKPRRRMAEGPANSSVRLSVLSAVNALYQNLPLVLGVQDGTPVKVAVLQAVDQHLGSGNVGGNRNIVHIADAQ